MNGCKLLFSSAAGRYISVIEVLLRAPGWSTVAAEWPVDFGDEEHRSEVDYHSKHYPPLS